ncbi:unnamed protein product, partial [Ectocarpus sp. 8 AP-2014]
MSGHETSWYCSNTRLSITSPPCEVSSLTWVQRNNLSTMPSSSTFALTWSTPAGIRLSSIDLFLDSDSLLFCYVHGGEKVYHILLYPSMYLPATLSGRLLYVMKFVRFL